MSALGYIASAALQLGLQSVLIRPYRSIGAYTMQVVIEEEHQDDLDITEHPVQQGATIADHATKRPATVTIIGGWSDSPTVEGYFAGLVSGVGGTLKAASSLLSGNATSQSRDMYAKLLALQSQRIPFDVYTGKRKYKSMLIKSLSAKTDSESAHMLRVTAVLQQVIIVSTTTTSLTSAPPAAHARPQSTRPTTDEGTKSLAPAPTFVSPK